MKITPEILEQWGGNPSPEIKKPVEFLDALNSLRVPRFSSDFLHYIRSYYRLSPEEFEAYCNYFEIACSENFWYSEDITDSRNVYNSYGVVGSVYVRNSSQVQNAIDVYNSQFIDKANDVAHSANVYGASRVFAAAVVQLPCFLCVRNSKACQNIGMAVDILRRAFDHDICAAHFFQSFLCILHSYV